MSVKIRVKQPSDKLYLDIHYFDIDLNKHVRHKAYLGMKNTPSNWKLIEREIIPYIEREISLGTYNPKTKRSTVSKLVKDYGEVSFKRHSRKRRSHVQNAKTYSTYFWE